MLSPRSTRRLFLLLLVVVGIGSGVFFVQAVAHAENHNTDTVRDRGSDTTRDRGSDAAPSPSASNPTGYCCLPSSAVQKGGICDPDSMQSFLNGTPPPGLKVSESDCQGGFGLAEPGKLWNNDSKLCAFYCGQALELWYCDPRENAQEESLPYTCLQQPVTRQPDDPDTIGFGYLYQKNEDIPADAPLGTTSCAEVCNPPPDLETKVSCPQACMRDDYECVITVRNKNLTSEAKVPSITATLGWYDTDNTVQEFSASKITGAVYEANGGDLLNYDADVLEPRKLRWPAAASPQNKIVIPAGGKFSVSVSVGQAGMTLAPDYVGTKTEGTLSVSVNAPFVPGNVASLSAWTSLTVGDTCGLDVQSECQLPADESEDPWPYVQYSATVPAGTGTATVEIAVPSCMDISGLIWQDDQNHPDSSIMTQPISADDGAAGDPGCWYTPETADVIAELAGTVRCNVPMNPDSVQFASYWAPVDTSNPDCASGMPIINIVAYVQTPDDDEPVATKPVTVFVASCTACDMCKNCMATLADGTRVTCAEAATVDETVAAAACTDEGRNPCRWIPRDTVFKEDSGQPINIPGRCAPDPEAVDTLEGKPMCDYSYGCCEDIGDEEDEEATWYYAFGYVRDGEKAEDFDEAKRCVLASDADSDVYFATDWARAPLLDNTGLGFYFPGRPGKEDYVSERANACTEDSDSSTSSTARSRGGTTGSDVNLSCDRRLRVANGEVFDRNLAAAWQTPDWTTTFFTDRKQADGTYNHATSYLFYSMAPRDSSDPWGNNPYPFAPVGDNLGVNVIEAAPACLSAQNVGTCCGGSDVFCPISTLSTCLKGIMLPFIDGPSTTCNTYATSCLDFSKLDEAGDLIPLVDGGGMPVLDDNGNIQYVDPIVPCSADNSVPVCA